MVIYLDKLNHVNIVFDLPLVVHTNRLIESHLALIHCLP
jgi:hypothetical protein